MDMNQKDKNMIKRRYGELASKYGYSSKSLGWGKVPQKYRFQALLKNFQLSKIESILDVGSGLSDLYSYLKEIGWKGKYYGIEIQPDLLEMAKKKYPTLSIRNLDILSNSFNEQYDLVIACGIFSEKLQYTDQFKYLQLMIEKMFLLSNVGVVADFLSDLVDFKNEISFHPTVEEISKIAKIISKRFLISHNYLPYEFSISLYKNQTINTNYTFNFQDLEDIR